MTFSNVVNAEILKIDKLFKLSSSYNVKWFMSEDVFLLLVGSDDRTPDVIYSRNSKLKIHVYYLNKTNHKPQANEIQLYSYHKSKLLMFETVDIMADDALDMISAIRWYARYLHDPEMEILPDDPRIDQEIAV